MYTRAVSRAGGRSEWTCDICGRYNAESLDESCAVCRSERGKLGESLMICCGPTTTFSAVPCSVSLLRLVSSSRVSLVIKTLPVRGRLLTVSHVTTRPCCSSHNPARKPCNLVPPVGTQAGGHLSSLYQI